MNTLKCEFVEASQLFKNCRKAWETFLESDPDCNFGSNNRTLVTPNVIVNALEGADCDKAVLDEVYTVLGKLYVMPSDMYIDLEN